MNDVISHSTERFSMSGVEILLIEDNRHDVEMILDAIGEQYTTDKICVLRDGAEALNYFFGQQGCINAETHHLPKLILLDLKLPKMTGLEVLHIIKNDRRTRHVPIVIVTSSRDEPDMKVAYEAGVNSYVVKPVDFEQFINSMSSLGLYWLLVNEPLK